MMTLNRPAIERIRDGRFTSGEMVRDLATTALSLMDERDTALRAADLALRGHLSAARALLSKEPEGKGYDMALHVEADPAYMVPVEACARCRALLMGATPETKAEPTEDDTIAHKRGRLVRAEPRPATERREGQG